MFAAPKTDADVQKIIADGVSESCWFSTIPLRHNTLHSTIARMCNAAGISGFKTNHSLRATAATRLYQSGVDEQLVMERMGHRSIDGIRSYKRTADFQRENISDILNCNASKRVGTVSMPLPMVSKHAGIESPNAMKNVVPGTYNFHSCANVTFNIQYGPTCTSNAQSINEH